MPPPCSFPAMISLPELAQGSRRLYLCSILEEDDNVLVNNNHNPQSPCWNLADCLSHVPLDVVASSHLEHAESTADVIHRSSSSSIASTSSSNPTRNHPAAVSPSASQDGGVSSSSSPPLRIVAPKLARSEHYLLGLEQILRDFDTAHHICLVTQDLLQATPLWRELFLLQQQQQQQQGKDQTRMDGTVGGGSCSSDSGCRIHVLDHHPSPPTQALPSAVSASSSLAAATTRAMTGQQHQWTLQLFNFCCTNNEWQ